MRAMSLALAFAFALALFAVPLVSASGAQPPADAAELQVGTRLARHWIDNGTLHVATLMDLQGANATAVVWTVNASSDTLVFEPGSATLRKDYSGVTTSEAFHFASFNFTTPNASATHSYALRFASFVEANGTLTEVANATAAGTYVVPAPPAGGIPTTWLVAGAAVLVVGGGAAFYAMRQREIKRRMQGEKRRSQVMREMELEQKLRRAEEKDPELAQEIKQEIRAQEQVREVRREMQILQAKRADAVKTLDLLKKRHEAGGLSKLQYDNMVAKKQADLARIDEEIAAMEREDAGAAA